MSQAFTLRVLALMFGISGSIVLAFPLFNIWYEFGKDDCIVEKKKKKDKNGKFKNIYTYRWLFKNRIFGFFGLGLLFLGFLLQLIDLILKIKK